MDNFDKAKAILKKYGQEKILFFYNELEEDEKQILINQILSLDFEQILTLYQNSYRNNFEANMSEISPIDHYEKELFTTEEKQRYKEIGDKVIFQNQVAVVTMAGGQGTRLGYKGPKGTYELLINEERISLYEILCNNLKEINKKYNITLNWYIMTSRENDEDTRRYLKEHNYWGYPRENIKFFMQSKLPLIKTDGKLFLKERYLIQEASNGNGDVFKALKRSNMIDDMTQKNIKYVFFGGIDNILLKNVDPLFLGLMIDKDTKIASKSIFKKEPLEKTAVYCLKKGRTSILNYDDIDEEITNKKFDDGRYCYREANMLSHIMSIDAVKDATKVNLPYHRAFKKNVFVNEEGMKEVPEKPNCFKFEAFIFDIFYYFDKMLLLRVNEDEEFAPIKSFNGKYTPDSAIEKFLNIKKGKNIDF